jgi:branched-chain amino acid transport system substrate-binding protein
LLPSAQLLTEAQKPAVIMISSTTAVVEKSPYFVRASGTLAQSSAIMADWAIRNGLNKAVTLVTEFAPGLEAEGTFTNNFKAAGGQLAEAIRVPLKNPDFAPFLQRSGMRRRKPYSCSFHRAKPPPSPSNSSSAASTRPASS